MVGLGYVGLPSAALMARSGYKVLGVDTNASLIDDLKRGHCRIVEVDVKEIVKATLATGGLEPAVTPQSADAFFICVPTPLTVDKKADMSMVRAAAQTIAEFVRPGNLIVLESTSPLNTTRDVVATEFRKKGIDPYLDVDICYCPERVFPGNTINEILKNDRVVGGLTPQAGQRARLFYESFCDGSVSVTDAAVAEFSKLMENTFRDVNIALANVFARIAEKAGIEIADVLPIANRHPRVNVHRPGPGVGGHCIPVDPWFLIDAFPEEAEFLKQARHINDQQAHKIVDHIIAQGVPSGHKVAILGAAYRANIDDARDTPTGLLIAALSEAGYTWQTHDPHVQHVQSHIGYDFNLTVNLAEAVSGASVAVLMTDHDAYRELGPSAFSEMRERRLYEGRALMDVQKFVAAGFTVSRLGGAILHPSVSEADLRV